MVLVATVTPVGRLRGAPPHLRGAVTPNKQKSIQSRQKMGPSNVQHARDSRPS
jgi:hypothetical protein